MRSGATLSYLEQSLINLSAIVCLWGNSTDLSLLINMSEDDIKRLQSTGGEHLASTEANILGNDMARLWGVVNDLRANTGGRIDFVLDNAGFELYCDCVYGAWQTLRDQHVATLTQPLSRSGFPYPKRRG